MKVTCSRNFGFANATKFYFWFEDLNILNPDVKFGGCMWNFGDGNSSTEYSPTHTYENEGDYTVTLTIFVVNVNEATSEVFYTSSLDVKIINYLQKAIYFEDVPPPTPAGYINLIPFKVNYTSNSVKNHSITIGLDKDDSYFSNNENTLSKNPQWYVLDSSLNLTNIIKPSQTNIYITNYDGSLSNEANGCMVGVSGTAEFYLVNDLTNITQATDTGNELSTIHATLNIEGEEYLINSEVKASIPHVYLWDIPSQLDVSHDVFLEMPKNIWAKAPLPVSIIARNKTLLGEYSKLDKDYYDHNLLLNTGVSAVDIQLELSSSTNESVLNFNKSFLYDYDYDLYAGLSENLLDISNTNTGTYTLSAQCTFPLQNYIGNNINPCIWTSNPKAGCLNKIQFQFSDSNAYFVNKYVRVPKLTYDTANFHGIDNIVSEPFPSFKTWVSDSSKSIVYLIDNDSSISLTIDLLNFYRRNEFGVFENIILENTHANQIVLDSNLNLWISFKYTNILASFNKYGVATQYYTFDPSDVILKFNISSLDYAIIQVYNSDSDELRIVKIDLKTLRIEQEWFGDMPLVSHIEIMPNQTQTDNDILFVFDQENQSQFWLTGPSLEILPQSYRSPSIVQAVAIDIDQNIWYTTNDSSLIKLNPFTGSSKIIIINSTTQPDIPISLQSIACDYRGVVFALNSCGNEIFILKDSGSEIEIVDSFIVNPSFSSNEYTDEDISPIQSLFFQGDPNSYKYSSKYYNSPINNSLTLSGFSDGLLIKEPKDTPNIKKINENFSFSETFKRLAHLPTLSNSNLLFDYFNTSLSHPDVNFNTDCYIYEKISNFISNNADIDTCSFSKLSDYASMVNFKSKIQEIYFPMAIDRLITIGSTDLNRVKGNTLLFSNNITNKYSEGEYNRGSKLKSQFTVDVGSNVILRNIPSDVFKLITCPAGPHPNNYTVDFLAINILKLGTNWVSEYEFYEHIPSQHFKSPTNSIIDWDSLDTTISLNDIQQQWMKNDGVLESLFSVALHQGLNFSLE